MFKEAIKRFKSRGVARRLAGAFTAFLIAALIIAFAGIGPALTEVGQAPEAVFENQVRQIVSEEVNSAFEKYSAQSSGALKPEELMNKLIPLITEQVVKRSLPLITSQKGGEAQWAGSELPLLQINDQKITVSDAIAEYMKLPQRSRNLMNNAEKLKEFLNDVVLVNRIIQMEARKKKFAEREDVKAQIEKAYESLLIEYYYRQIKDEAARASEVTPAEVNAFYEENKAERFQIKDCVKLANILTRFTPGDSDSVQVARTKIEKAKMEIEIGTPFEKVWEQYSDDREHKNGVLGTFKKDVYNKNSVINEAFSRNRGEYTNIIKGNNAFYILKVLEKNDSKTIPLVDVKSIIENELRLKKENDYLSKWFEKVKTRYNVKVYRDKIGGDPDTLEVIQSSNLIESQLSAAPAASETSEIKVSADQKNNGDGDDEKSSKKVSKKNGSKKKSSEKGKSKQKSSKKNGSGSKEKAAAKTSKPEEAENDAKNARTPAQPAATDLNEALAEVDGIKITRLMYNETLSHLPGGHGKNLTKASERLAVVDKLVNRIILKKEALIAQVNNLPEFKKEMAEIENKTLARTLIFEEVTKNIEPSAEELKSYYERNSKEYRVRHILISIKNQNDQTELENARSKAMTAYQKIDSDSFEQVAKLYSDDVSKSEGGLLPYFTFDDMVESFSDAVQSMKPGEISKPVLTNFGFHIIKLEEVRPVDFSEDKNKIKEKLMSMTQKKQLVNYIETLKKSYEYSFNDANIAKAVEHKLFYR